MTALTFPRSPIATADDPTEHHWSAVAGLARDFERAAQDATSVGRCVQLHERLHACLKTLNDADDRVRERWDALLARGGD